MGKTLDSSLQSYNFFEALFSNTKQNAVFVMDEKGIIQETNSAFTDFFGFREDDIIGQKFHVLFTEEDQKKGMPENELKEVLSTGQSNDNNYLVNKNKTLTWVAGESILVKDDKGKRIILKVIQDIHKQKTYEQSLLHLNQFNERILSSIDDIVIVIDNKTELIKANKAFHQLCKDDDDLCFKKFVESFDNKDEFNDKLKRAIKTGTGFIAKGMEVNIFSGEKRIFDVSCRSLEEEKDVRNLLLVLHDVTINHDSEKQREDIIGFVAHELRNPLANIVLCNELMSETLKENKLKESLDFLSRSKNNVLRLNKMIAELYDATKVGSGNMQLETSVFNFEDMINEAIETIKVLQPMYKIVVSGNADIKVHGDKYRLIQVVTNYLSNGIKYSEGSDEVELEIKHDGKLVIVSVKDKGLGISKDQLPYIFNRFFRAEKTKNFEGIGLGLYLCRQIIKAHNGKVWAESEEGKGSIFHFSIPL